MSWTYEYFFDNFENILKSSILIVVFAREMQNDTMFVANSLYYWFPSSGST